MQFYLSIYGLLFVFLELTKTIFLHDWQFCLTPFVYPNPISLLTLLSVPLKNRACGKEQKYKRDPNILLRKDNTQGGGIRSCWKGNSINVAQQGYNKHLYLCLFLFPFLSNKDKTTQMCATSLKKIGTEDNTENLRPCYKISHETMLHTTNAHKLKNTILQRQHNLDS